jgi:rhodanese-related sulfurtransferase
MVASIPIQELRSRLAAPDAPLVLDVRRRQFHAASPAVIAGSSWRDPTRVEEWRDALPPGRDVVVYCVHGLHVGRTVAEKLEAAGRRAAFLEGGMSAWREAGGATSAKPVKGVRWLTRERPKIDRVACPWLIRRFLDPLAAFDYVPPERVLDAARETNAVPYDVPGVRFAHRGERCSFDAILEDFGLREPSLEALAVIVRGADTARLDLAPQAAGLLAVSLGLSRTLVDDAARLEAAMPVYDALYAWCREAHGGNRPS